MKQMHGEHLLKKVWKCRPIGILTSHFCKHVERLPSHRGESEYPKHVNTACEDVLNMSPENVPFREKDSSHHKYAKDTQWNVLVCLGFDFVQRIAPRTGSKWAESVLANVHSSECLKVGQSRGTELLTCVGMVFMMFWFGMVLLWCGSL